MHGFTEIGPAVDSGLPAIVTFRGDSGLEIEEAEILAELQRMLPGDICYGHLHASPGIIKFFAHSKVASYFIVRDPRDVVVSHAHYVTDMEPRHIHHLYYKDKLPDFNSRLSTSIQGINIKDLAAAGMAGEFHRELPDIWVRFKPFLSWLDYPDMLLIHYEDLLVDQEKQLRAILDHAVQHGFETRLSSQLAVEILQHSINPQKSPTFRSGKIGGWKSSFTEEHKRLFKELSGDLLQRLGYESNHDW